MREREIEIFTNEVISAIKDVIGGNKEKGKIALHEPTFDNTNAWEYVKDCLDTRWVSSGGKWVEKFEQMLSEMTKAKHAVAVTNGTVGLRLAMQVVGVRAGDEVLIPPISFVATANAVAHIGATPHFIDIEKKTLGMCPEALEKRLKDISEYNNGILINKYTQKRIAAIVPVHIFGLPGRIDELIKIAEKWEIPVIEDAAESLGSTYNRKHCGTSGKIGVISFNGNKIITTGGGGALLIDDDKLAEKARHLSTTAKVHHPWEYEHDQVGWNDRMPNINAALGVAQLEDLEKRIMVKRKLAEKYMNRIGLIKGLQVIKESDNSRSNYWLIAMRILQLESKELDDIRGSILRKAFDQGIMLRPVWKPLNKLKMYGDCPRGELKNSEDQAKRVINLPSSPQLIEEWKN